ncbi:MAG: pentapeptide repeat-containing protein [Rubricella sp.]
MKLPPRLPLQGSGRRTSAAFRFNARLVGVTVLSIFLIAGLSVFGMVYAIERGADVETVAMGFILGVAPVLVIGGVLIDRRVKARSIARIAPEFALVPRIPDSRTDRRIDDALARLKTARDALSPIEERAIGEGWTEQQIAAEHVRTMDELHRFAHLYPERSLEIAHALAHHARTRSDVSSDVTPPRDIAAAVYAIGIRAPDLRKMELAVARAAGGPDDPALTLPMPAPRPPALVTSGARADVLRSRRTYEAWIEKELDRPGAGSGRPAMPLTEIFLHDVDLDGLNLSRIDFGGARLSRVRFNGTDLSSSVFQRLRSRSARFGRVQASGADFSDAALDSAIFSESFLVRALFERSSLRMASFRGCLLAGATLNGLDLVDARFEDCRLPFARLERCNAQRMSLEGCDLRYARLSGLLTDEATRWGNADLAGAALRDLDLRDVRGTPRNLDLAFADRSVLLPERMERPAHWPEGRLTPVAFEKAYNAWLDRDA